MKEPYRVYAVRNATETTVYAYGGGVYVGDKPVPVGTMTCFGVIDQKFLNLTEGNFTNPCIELDQGGVVWGCQCWWGEEEPSREKFQGREEIIVPPES